MKKFFKISVLSLLAGLSLSLTACGSGSNGTNGNGSNLGAGAIGSCQTPSEFTFDAQIGLCCVPGTQVAYLQQGETDMCEPTLSQLCAGTPATPYANYAGFNGQSVQLYCTANPY